MFAKYLVKGCMLWLLSAWHMTNGECTNETSATQSSPRSIAYTNVEYTNAIKNLELNYVQFDDMMIPKASANETVGKSVIANPRYRWTKAIVPFVIHESLANQRSRIISAMNQYNRHTCIRFKFRETEKNFVVLHAGRGCSSTVGMRGDDQLLSLGPGCYDEGTIVHELGHAIGFSHEHQRSDRDENIIIHFENIEKGQEYNFGKMSPDDHTLYTNYDPISIMQYGEYAFSKDTSRLKTITSKKGVKLLNPGLKAGLSKDDIFRINKAYGCY